MPAAQWTLLWTHRRTASVDVSDERPQRNTVSRHLQPRRPTHLCTLESLSLYKISHTQSRVATHPIIGGMSWLLTILSHIPPQSLPRCQSSHFFQFHPQVCWKSLRNGISVHCKIAPKHVICRIKLKIFSDNRTPFIPNSFPSTEGKPFLHPIPMLRLCCSPQHLRWQA